MRKPGRPLLVDRPTAGTRPAQVEEKIMAEFHADFSELGNQDDLQISGDDDSWLVREGTLALNNEINAPSLSYSPETLPALTLSNDAENTGISTTENNTESFAPVLNQYERGDSSSALNGARLRQAIESADGNAIVRLMNDVSTVELFHLVKEADERMKTHGVTSLSLSLDDFDRVVLYDRNDNKGVAIDGAGLYQRVSQFYDDSFRYGPKSELNERTQQSLDVLSAKSRFR